MVNTSTTSGFQEVRTDAYIAWWSERLRVLMGSSSSSSSLSLCRTYRWRKDVRFTIRLQDG